MIRVVLALVALTLPALTRAEEIYRWQGANGSIHYSNQPAHVPSDAIRLPTGRTLASGALGAPATPSVEPAERTRAPKGQPV